MSIIWGPLPADMDNKNGGRDAEEHFVYEPLAGQGGRCFLCSEPLDYPIIQWHGEVNIFLHTGCAARLAIHLAKDSYMAEKGLDERILRRHLRVEPK